jgi:hypothetical protein
MESAQRILWYLSTGAQVMLTLYLLACGLFRRYPFLTLFHGVSSLGSLLMFSLNIHSQAYFKAWCWAEILNLLLLLSLTLESYYLSMKNYRTERKEFTYILLGALLIAAALSFIGMIIDSQEVGFWQRLHHSVFLARRCVLGILFVFAAVTGWHFWYFPAPASHNLRAYRRVSLIYISQLTILQFAATLSPASLVPMISLAGLCASIPCFAAWALTMRPSGEYTEPPSPSPGEIEAVETRAIELEDFMQSRGRTARR